MMKKILCLILALATLVGSVFALASCGGDDEELTLYEIAKTSSPTKTVTIVEYTTYTGDELDGYYSVEKEGGNSIFYYNYNRPLTPEEAIELGTTDRIYNFEGYVYHKDNKYSTDGVTYSDITPDETPFKFNLQENYLTGATLNEEGTRLEATVTASNAIQLFGSALKALGDVQLVVETDGTYLREVTLTYTTVTNATVKVTTSYSYNSITLEFPSQEG